MPGSSREHSSGSSEPQSNLTVTQAVSSYLSSIPQGRATAAQELNNFARWFGGHRAIRSITPPELERYQEQLAGEARTDLTDRLETLRRFLAEAKHHMWTDTNLAVEIKIKKTKAATGSKSAKTLKRGDSADASAIDTLRLTREGFDKLANELQLLEMVMRPQISLELKTAAADKDFRENAPYDVAKQHQGEVEARIRELKRVLETGEVVDVGHTAIIDLGSKVTLHDLTEEEKIVYILVGPGEIDPKHGKISIQSPVGRALSGKTVGDELEVEVPSGTIRLRVVKVEHR